MDEIEPFRFFHFGIDRTVPISRICFGTNKTLPRFKMNEIERGSVFFHFGIERTGSIRNIFSKLSVDEVR